MTTPRSLVSSIAARPVRCALVVAMLAAASTAALAHRTWVLPSSMVVDDENGAVTLDAAVSEDLFEYDTNALQIDTLRITAPDGKVLAPESRHQGRRRTSFEVKLPQPGTYRIAGVAETAMASYKLDGGVKRWRGLASAVEKEIPANATDVQITRTHSRVETFVTQGDSGQPVPAPTGVGLELVPLTQPTDLNTGDTSRFRLLLDGQPAANADVTLVRAGHRYRYKMGEIGLKTDARGEFSVTWSEAGRYWLGASTGGRAGMGEAAAPSPAAARRATYSATFEVLPQ